MDRPLIGVTPSWDTQKHHLRMYPGYMNGILEAGGVPVVLPLTEDDGVIEQLARQLDGFLFTGGPDVDPARYGAELSPACGFIDTLRDILELKLFSEVVLRQNKPCFGICRGIQLINVALGGTLYQDIPSEIGALVNHDQQELHDAPAHAVEIFRDTPLHSLFGENRICINSLHHQGIKRLADRLLPMAVAEDGVVEAVYMRDARFVWAVQWHPEGMQENVYSMHLFKTFVDACRI